MQEKLKPIVRGYKNWVLGPKHPFLFFKIKLHSHYHITHQKKLLLKVFLMTRLLLKIIYSEETSSEDKTFPSEETSDDNSYVAFS